MGSSGEEILVWTVRDDDGKRIGLAAIYDTDKVEPYDDDDDKDKRVVGLGLVWYECYGRQRWI